jgi:diguanylate cyclase (GGDEF)-like protein
MFNAREQVQPMRGSQTYPVRHLLVVEDPQGRRSILLEEENYSLGRGSTNSIVLHSKMVSRQHATLLRVTTSNSDSHRFRIIDGDMQGNHSTNGLFVNGQRCFSRDLKHGDVIEFSAEVKARYVLATANLSDQDVLAYTEAMGTPTSQWENSKGTLIAEIQEPGKAGIARLASIPELSPHPILEIDLAGTITYLNPAAAEKFPNLQIIGTEHPMLAGLVSMVQDRGDYFFTRQVQIGEECFEQSVHYLAAGDLIRSFITDITQRKQAEVELYRRDRLLQSVATAANHLLTNPNFDVAIADALATLGMAAEVDRVYVYENHLHPETAEMAMSLRYEWTRESVMPLLNHPHWKNRPYSDYQDHAWYETLAQGKSVIGPSHDFPALIRNTYPQDDIRSFLNVPIQVEGYFWGFIGFDDSRSARIWTHNEEVILSSVATSISGAIQRQQTEAMMRYQAYHDLLTDLPNRTLFNDRLAVALASASRSSEQLAVMFLDLDRFKTINDTLGHTVGDSLLQNVSQRLIATLREGDTVARWGGDEFTILLPQITHVDDVSKAAQRVIQALEEPFCLEEHELYITPSIGIAIYNTDGEDAETLIKHADAALYQAKQMGRNNYRFFTPAMSAEAPELLALEQSLRRALEREEFLLHYQPQINIKTGKIVGMEALLRWQHPEMGLVSPKIFMPVAEESGLIVPIGEWVLRTACAQNRAWQEQGLSPICIGVNLSARQFHQPNLAEMIARVLQETGLDPQYLDLEVTETTAVQDVDFTKSVLQEMHRIGVNISMDDFGTGYSSLSHLKQFPLNTLKIDQSFVQDVTANTRDAHIVTAVITMARGLSLSVIAEGVETSAQLDFLQTHDCEHAQGYLFSRPLVVSDAAKLLAASVLPLAEPSLTP